jgi:anti-anti-sigma factor
LSLNRKLNSNLKGKTMTTNGTQVWQGTKFNVERSAGNTAGEVVFRFSGPFTARDMYGSIAPAAFRELLESSDGCASPTSHVLDLTAVPYVDSAGLGIIAEHFAKCQAAGIRMIAIGLGARVLEQFRITKLDKIIPYSV